ncbi:MAG: hypothetical protein M3Q78_10870 [Acidobacteriota bacterium]|nr:hypothetical protein [Acidobacteriota bacterium]
MTKKSILQNIFVGLFFVCSSAGAAFAQTTEFTYQGKLTDTGTPSATYDFEFRLCNSATDCTTPLATQQRLGVPVSGGVFTVTLDFGATNFDGANRWLEIAVKRPAQATFTTLTPRQPLTSAPYAIRSLRSFDAENLGGVPAVSYLQNNGDGTNLTNVAKLDASNIFTGTDNTFPQITLSGDGQIIAPRLENSATDPAPASAANAGRIYFNTTDNTVKVSDGTAWVNLSPSASPNIQTFSGATAFATISCTGAAAIRTAVFTKNSATSRLRITYKDTAGGFGTTGFLLIVLGRIDGTAISNPIGLRMTFGSNGGGSSFVVNNSFTAFGYANNVTAGSHTLTFVYNFTGGANNCFRDSEPFQIEIEEVP